MNEEQPASDIILHQAEDGQTRLDVRLDGGTAWLTQALLAELYQTTIQNIGLHFKNIYDDKELTQEATIKDYLIVRQEGQQKSVVCRVFQWSRQHFLSVFSLGKRKCRRSASVNSANSYLHPGAELNTVCLTHPPRLYSFGSKRTHGGYFFVQALGACA